MIRIVHIAKPIGGVGVYIQLLAKNLNSKEFKNTVLLNNSDQNLDLIDQNGNQIKSFHVNLQREINLINDFKSLFKLINHLKKIEPNIIHCHSAKAGILGRIAGAVLNIPVFYTPHAYSYLSAENTFKKFIYKFIEKTFRFFPSKTLACSISEYNRTVNDLGFEKNKVLVWKNSIDEFSPEKRYAEIDSLPQQYICTIGRPSYQKNTELLIKSIYEVKKHITSIHLVILGVGYYSPFLEQIKLLIKELDLSDNITLIDFINREECLSVLQKSQFFVSTSRYEGLPYAGIEALMLKKPCIMTNVDGNKDLINDGINGFLTKDETNAIAERIIHLCKNPKKIDIMGEASYQKFKSEFHIESNINCIEKIYKLYTKVEK
jgi:glycosyltransferase involved in cell wall biosynthesis